MANDTLSTLKLNSLNLGCTSLEEDTFGYSQGWSNVHTGSNLYSPLIIPFQKKYTLNFYNYFGQLFYTFKSTPLLSIDWNRNLHLFNPAVADSFAVLPKYIEVFAATMPTPITFSNPFNERIQPFTYLTRLNMALDDTSPPSSFKFAVDNNREVKTPESYFGANFGTLPPAELWATAGTGAFIEIVANANTSPILLSRPQNTGLGVVTLPVDDNGFNFQINNLAYVIYGGPDSNNFEAEVNLKGYVKIA